MSRDALSHNKKQRRISIVVSCVLCLAAGTLLLNAAPTNDVEQHRIVEKVNVINVEVPVRVMHKGKPITDLRKDDFILYENKKRMDINGFFLKRKQIVSPGKTAQSMGSGTGSLAPRTFVIVFSVTDFNENLAQAVDHLFANVLRPKDRLLVFANDESKEYKGLYDKEAVKKELINNLAAQARDARRRLVIYINKIETYLNVHDFKVKLHKQDNTPLLLVQFLKKYLLAWNDYKKRYLTPRVDRFYYFSRYLEALRGDKWVLNFYQFDLFPKIKLGSNTMYVIRDMATRLMNSQEATAHAMGKMINLLLNQITMDLNVSKGFPVEAVSKLFHKVDATFHCFFIRGVNRMGSNDLEYEEVASDLQNTLRRITRVTGGEIITSNRLITSIDTVTQIEDAYYILTYVPKKPEKAGKIKIKVKNKKYKVLYDDNFRADYISDYLDTLGERLKSPDIKIRDFSFKGKILAFTLRGFQMKNPSEEAAAQGNMTVRIRLTDKENNSLYDEERFLTAQKQEVTVSLAAFKKIKRGEYNFLIDALDLLTGKEANYHSNIRIKR